MRGFSWIDGVVLAGLAWPAFSGFRAGLVGGLLRTGALVAGALAGFLLEPMFSPWLAARLSFPVLAGPALCLLAGAAAGWVAGRLLAQAWRKATDDHPVGWLDRFAGASLGLAKGLVFVGAFLGMLSLAAPGLGVARDLDRSWSGLAVKPLVDGLKARALESVRRLRREGAR